MKVPKLCENCENSTYFKGEEKCWIWWKYKKKCSRMMWQKFGPEQGNESLSCF